MLTVHHAPMTRSTRVVWLLEELGLAYDLRRVEFKPPKDGFFSQQTPLGKLPVIEDDGVPICESGAILEYVLERYGEGRLAPPVGTALRGVYLQWIHHAEGTLYPPLGTMVFHTFYRQDASELPSVMDDARGRAGSALDFLAEQMKGPFVLGEHFSAADIMLGFTLVVAQVTSMLPGRWPELVAYLERLQERPAYQRMMTA